MAAPVRSHRKRSARRQEPGTWREMGTAQQLHCLIRLISLQLVPRTDVDVYYQNRGSLRELPTLEFDLTYLKQLIGAGLINEVTPGTWGRTFASRSGPWTPAAIGTTLGVLTTPAGKRKSASRTAGRRRRRRPRDRRGLGVASRGLISHAARTARRVERRVTTTSWRHPRHA
jgi:hypothetical protein